MDKEFYEKNLWSWLTQLATAYALAVILIVVFSLMFNGFDKAHVILEFNVFIRIAEIVGGIFSFIILLANFIIKFSQMAEQ